MISFRDFSLFVVCALFGVQSRAALPVFTAQPAPQIARAGDTVWFEVAADNSPAAYQWRANGVDIPDATAAVYTTAAVSAAMDGTLYSVVVANSSGSVTSDKAKLRVLPALDLTMVFGDEFDGAQIDDKKWEQMGDVPRQKGFWWKGNSYLSGRGQLVLRTSRNRSGQYGSGAIRTRGKFERAFGYFEAKMKFQQQQGHWSAFWLMCDSQGHVGNEGRDGTEIDILEKAWLTDKVQHALHWDGYGPSHKSAGHPVKGMGMDDGGWHLCGVDWTTTEYKFYIDGVLTWTTAAGGVNQVPCYIKCTDEVGNFGIGPEVWGTGPISDATLPDYTYFEYVRVYAGSPPVRAGTSSKSAATAGPTVPAETLPPSTPPP